MLTTIAIENYRSIRRLVIPLGRLNVVTGPNGSGKSNLYRAIRLLASAAHDNVVATLAREGGMTRAMFAGPATVTREMKSGGAPVQGLARREAVRLRLGFAGEDFGYSIALGYPPNVPPSAFALDPEIKNETIWGGPVCRPSAVLVSRERPLLRVREKKSWNIVTQNLRTFESMFAHLPAAASAPEALQLREQMHQWRFYDHFRSDVDAPARQAQVGTRTAVLAHDGSDVAAALQTIIEIGDEEALRQSIDDAFPASSLGVDVNDEGRFALRFQQHGLLRPLSAAEVSDGTLRYFLLVAALLTPRPPSLMVLNEPETSLHPDLLPALGRLIIRASQRTQMWVVTHATRLIAALEQDPDCNALVLDKELGATVIVGQRSLDEPSWHWPADS
jgi:predicted ATPase